MMYTLILFAALCIALASCCPGQAQPNWDQVQRSSPYWPNTRSRQQVHYGPVFIHSYGRPHSFYRGRSEPGINQPYNGEYMTHLLLANQVPGPSNDNMAQLLYDNSAQPQLLNTRNAAQMIYDPAAVQSQQMYARNMAQQQYMYPGLYTRYANNLDVYDDNDYVLVPAVTCLH